MSKTDKLRGGLKNLIPTHTSDIETEEATSQEEQTKAGREALLDAIEDPELREALRREDRVGRGRPRRGDSRLRQDDLYIRFCALVRREQIAKLRAICKTENVSIKETLEVILGNAIAVYESKNGKVEPQPKAEHKDVSSLFTKN